MAYDRWIEKKKKKWGRTFWQVLRISTTRKKPKIMKGTITAKQYAIKTSPNTYNLVMKGVKRRQ